MLVARFYCSSNGLGEVPEAAVQAVLHRRPKMIEYDVGTDIEAG
jgi:hypothetical protein